MLPLVIHLSLAFLFFLRQEDMSIQGVAMALLSTLAVGFLILSYALTRHFALYFDKSAGSVSVA